MTVRRRVAADGCDAAPCLAVRLRSHGAQGERPPLHPQPPREPQQHQEHAGVPRRPGLRDRRRRHLVGQTQAWLQCIDATQTGDVTDSALLWSYPVERHCCSTPSIHDGLVYVADCGGKVHCVDAETGRPCGSTTPAARSGPRPWWPTARSTSARGARRTLGLGRRPRKTGAQFDPPGRPGDQHGRRRQRHALRRHDDAAVRAGRSFGGRLTLNTRLPYSSQTPGSKASWPGAWPSRTYR